MQAIKQKLTKIKKKTRKFFKVTGLKRWSISLTVNEMFDEDWKNEPFKVYTPSSFFEKLMSLRTALFPFKKWKSINVHLSNV